MILLVTALERRASDIGFALGQTFAQTGMKVMLADRPTRWRMPSADSVILGMLVAELGRSAMDPMDVAAQVLVAMRGDQLYVFTHSSPSWRAELAERFGATLAAMDAEQ